MLGIVVTEDRVADQVKIEGVGLEEGYLVGGTIRAVLVTIRTSFEGTVLGASDRTESEKSERYRSNDIEREVRGKEEGTIVGLTVDSVYIRRNSTWNDCNIRIRRNSTGNDCYISVSSSVKKTKKSETLATLSELSVRKLKKRTEALRRTLLGIVGSIEDWIHKPLSSIIALKEVYKDWRQF